FCFHQRFHLRIIDLADRVLIEEVRDFRVVTHKTKAVTIERERLLSKARIADRHAMGVERAAAAHVGLARHRRLGEDLLPVSENVVDGSFDGFVDRFPFDDLNHSQLLGVAAARLFLCGSGRSDISPPGGQDNPHRISLRLRHARAVELAPRGAETTGILLLEGASVQCSSTPRALPERYFMAWRWRGERRRGGPQWPTTITIS